MKQFLTIILIFSYSFVLSQETMVPSPDDFEGNVNVSASDETGTWENNGTEMDPTFYNGIRYQPDDAENTIITIIEDPTDSSNKVMKYEDSGTNFYANVKYQTEKKMDLSLYNKFIVRAYVEPGFEGTKSGDINYPSLSFRLQNRELSSPWETDKRIHKQLVNTGEWVTAEFDFSKEFGDEVINDTQYDQIVIQFNMEGANDAVIGYIDDLTIVEGSAFVADETMSPVGDNFEGSVNIDANNDSTYNNGVRYQPGSPGDEAVELTVVSDPTDSSNKVLKYSDTGNWWSQMRLQYENKLDLKTLNKFTVRAYVPSALMDGNSSGSTDYPSLSFRLQNRDLSAPYNSDKRIHKELVADQWNTVEFDFKREFGNELINSIEYDQIVIQFNMEGNSDKVVGYLDDLSVSEGSTPLPNAPSDQAPDPGYSNTEVLPIWSSRYQNGYVFDVFSKGTASTNGNTFNASWSGSSLDKHTGINEELMKFTNLSYVGNEFASPFIDVSTYDFVHMDIWAKEDGFIQFFLLDEIKPESKKIIEVKGQQWNTIKLKICDFDTVEKQLLKTAVQKFKWNNDAGGTPSIFYVANLLFYKDSSVVCTPPSDVEPDSKSSDPNIDSSTVKSIFGDTYTSLDWSGPFNSASWNDGVLVAPFELKNGNSVIKLKNLNYGGIYLEATSTDSGTVQDFTGMTHMVMDVWSKNGEEFDFFFFDGGSEQKSTLSPSKSSDWERIIVPLSDFHLLPEERELNLTSVSGFKFDPAGSNIEMMYIDNWFFSNSNSLAINDLKSFSFTIYPNPVTSVISISSDLKTNQVDIYSVTGAKIDTRKVKENSVDVSNLNSGVYFIKYDKAFSKFIKK